MIYIDKPKQWKPRIKYSHMISDNVQELHLFAAKIGLKNHWFENKKDRGQPHYDVPEIYFQTAIDNGAEIMELKEQIKFLKEHYNCKVIPISVKQDAIKDAKRIEIYKQILNRKLE